MRDLVTTLAFLLPFRRLKVRLLNLAGHDVHPTAYIGVCLVRHVERFELAEGAMIGHFNFFAALDKVTLGRGSRITYFNWIVGAGALEEGQEPGKSTLQMGSHCHIISFHYLDCSGGLVLEDDCWITGIRTTILTHAFDPHDGGMIVEPVVLKSGSVVATSCTILPGTVIGEGSLMAAGSTAWTRQQLAEGSLHGGVPARRLAPIKISDWVYNRHRYQS